MVAKKAILVFILTNLFSSFLGLFVGIIFNEPITQFFQKYILHQNTDIVVTISTNFYLPNNRFLNLTDFRNNMTINLNYSLNSIKSPKDFEKILSTTYPLVVDDNVVSVPILSLITKVPLWNTSINECLITSFAGGTILNKGVIYQMRASYSSSQPSCQNCIQNALDISNQGNSEATNLRVEVCPKPNFYISSLENREGVSLNYGCVNIEKPLFLPSDRLSIGFNITGFGNYSSYVDVYNDAYKSLYNWQLVAWDNEEKNIPNDKLIHLVNVIITNCTV